MNKKIVLTILGILGFIAFPVKLILEFVNPGSISTVPFAVLFTSCVFFMMIFSSKLPEERVQSFQKNLPMSVVSAICSLGYACGALAYFKNPAPSDCKTQCFFLATLCTLSCLFFIFVFYSHFSGNNPFKKLQLLVFAPVATYLVSLTLFFSFEIKNLSPYNVAAQSLTLMFFVYYSHFYVKCSNKNFRRRAFIFGIPAIILTWGYSIPQLALNPLGSLEGMTSIMYILNSLYIFAFLASDLKKDFILRGSTQQ